MTLFRKFAMRLLHEAAEHSSGECREWADAMLRELDFVESDWQALLWALGSTQAIFRHSGTKLWFRRHSKEARMNDLGKKAVGLVEGIAMAFGLVLLALGLLWIGFRYFPSLGLEQSEWTHLVLVIIIPEIVFVVAAVALWRKRKPMAVGILLWGAVLATHVVLHLASHGMGH